MKKYVIIVAVLFGCKNKQPQPAFMPPADTTVNIPVNGKGFHVSARGDSAVIIDDSGKTVHHFGTEKEKNIDLNFIPKTKTK